eukprot:6785453-Karenia_brevis.AAC.1
MKNKNYLEIDGRAIRRPPGVGNLHPAYTTSAIVTQLDEANFVRAGVCGMSINDVNKQRSTQRCASRAP